MYVSLDKIISLLMSCITSQGLSHVLIFICTLCHPDVSKLWYLMGAGVPLGCPLSAGTDNFELHFSDILFEKKGLFIIAN